MAPNNPEKPTAETRSSGSADGGHADKTRAAIHDTPAVDGNDETKPHLHAKTYLAVFAVCLVYFCQIYAVVGAGSLTNTISQTLSDTRASVWLASSVAIGTAVLSPIFSQSADYWGRRPFLVVSTLLGAVGCVIVARASSMGMAVAGTTVISINFGAQPLLHAVSSEVLPRRYRSWGQAADLVSNAFGGITAMLVGGAFVRKANVPSEGFRNFWYLGTALYAVAAVLCFVLYNPPATERETSLTLTEKLGRLDWVGYGLLTGGIVLFCVGLSWSQNPFPWSDPHTSATFAVGMALLVGLGVYETWVKKDGMLHHALFRNRNFPIALAALFCEGLAFFAANNYFAFQVGVLYEGDALLVGLRYSITMFVSIFSAVGAGLYCAKTKKVRWITVTSFLLFVVFFACMANTTPETNVNTWGYPVFLGTALGMSLVSLITLAQLSTQPDLIAITSGLVIGVRSLGGSVGLAIYNALFSDAMHHLGDNIAGATLGLGLPPSSVGPLIGALTAHDDAALAKIPGVTPEIIGAGAQALLGTFSEAFKRVWIAAACFVALAAFISVFIKDPTHEFNMHIDNPIEREEDLYSQSDKA